VEVDILQDYKFMRSDRNVVATLGIGHAIDKNGNLKHVSRLTDYILHLPQEC
jgi:hypothetical protein